MALKDILAKIRGSKAGGAGVKALLGGVRDQVDAAIEAAAKEHGLNLPPEARAAARKIVDAARDKVADVVAEHEAHADETAAAIAAPPS